MRWITRSLLTACRGEKSQLPDVGLVIEMRHLDRREGSSSSHFYKKATRSSVFISEWQQTNRRRFGVGGNKVGTNVWWMKAVFSFKQAFHRADINIYALIKGCRWRWDRLDNICNNGLWEMALKADVGLSSLYLRGPITDLSVKNNDRAFEYDEPFLSGPHSSWSICIVLPCQQQEIAQPFMPCQIQSQGYFCHKAHMTLPTW